MLSTVLAELWKKLRLLHVHVAEVNAAAQKTENALEAAAISLP